MRPRAATESSRLEPCTLCTYVRGRAPKQANATERAEYSEGRAFAGSGWLACVDRADSVRLCQLETARVVHGPDEKGVHRFGLTNAVASPGARRIVLMFVPAQRQDAFDPRQPFSRGEARAAGLTPEMLFSFHKIFWDAYVAREVPITPLLRAKAVLRLVPSGSYISHHTAAELLGAAPPARCWLGCRSQL